jgi:hypothetical protein
LDFDAVLLFSLFSIFGLFPICFRGIIFRGFLFGFNRRLSLFALKPVDFVSQSLVLVFKFLVFLAEDLDKVEQFASAIKGVFKAPDVVDVQIG